MWLFCRAICEKGFKTEARGQIEVRGLAPMETYFLIKNEKSTDDAIIGRPNGGPKLTQVNEKNGANSKEGKSISKKITSSNFL